MPKLFSLFSNRLDMMLSVNVSNKVTASLIRHFGQQENNPGIN